MKLKRIGVDLAKQVFQVHGVDSHEQVVCRKQIKRARLLDFFRQLEPCLVVMEACGGSHYWARQFRALGHEVRLIAPQFVKPYVKGGKNDANDAEAICEAGSKSGRQLAAWLGLVPNQHSSGGKERLGSISKRGDTYLRTLLIHGARSALNASAKKTDPRSIWINEVKSRRNTNIATVALANKNARIIWALLSKGESYHNAAC